MGQGNGNLGDRLSLMEQSGLGNQGLAPNMAFGKANLDTFKMTLQALAAGDAIGYPIESIADGEALVKRFKINAVEGFIEKKHGRYDYSDDTQQSLMIARSIGPDGVFDPQSFADELVAWQYYSIGAGYTSKVACSSLEQGRPWHGNFYCESIVDRGKKTRLIDYRSSQTNGTTMRVAPLALANLCNRPQMELGIWQASITSHGHPSAALAALLVGETVRSLATGESNLENIGDHLGQYLHSIKIPESEAFQTWRSEWNKGQGLGEKLEDYLAAAQTTAAQNLAELAAVKNKTQAVELMQKLGVTERPTKYEAMPTFFNSLIIAKASGGDCREAVLWSANIYGSDTDTLAALAGQICGAVDSGASFPGEWAGQVQDHGYLETVAENLHSIAAGTCYEKSALLPRKNSKLPDLMENLAAKNLEKGEFVNHDILGVGKVKNFWVHTPKDEPPRAWARVHFHCGQSCLFKSY